MLCVRHTHNGPEADPRSAEEDPEPEADEETKQRVQLPRTMYRRLPRQLLRTAPVQLALQEAQYSLRDTAVNVAMAARTWRCQEEQRWQQVQSCSEKGAPVHTPAPLLREGKALRLAVARGAVKSPLSAAQRADCNLYQSRKGLEMRFRISSRLCKNDSNIYNFFHFKLKNKTRILKNKI